MLSHTNLRDNTYRVGFFMLILSLVAFQVMEVYETPGGFFLHYLLFIVYFIITRVARKRMPKKDRARMLPYNLLLLLLANISCYALNRDVPVFHESSDWLTVYLVIFNTGLLIWSLRPNYAPSNWNFLLVVLFSTGLLFNIYEAIYVLPMYGIGVMAFWLFGISLHIFVPIWYCIQLWVILKKFISTEKSYKYAILGGVMVPLVFAALFTLSWLQLNRQIESTYQENISTENELPVWVQLGQQLAPGWITKRVLKSGVFYTEANLDFSFGFGGFGGRMNMEKVHDPLIVTASLFSGPLDLDASERVKLIKGVYNDRHQTQERLWSGDNLQTKEIQTTVQLFPRYRLSYTEKTFTIHNYDEDAWPRNQEALYTFYLPKGSVVTSASLWIEGEERPAILTTKSKADSAYRTIVGREKRDPLLIHWQEGNLLTVKVFPCTPGEDRQFKIGITTPLEWKENQLIYHNIDFKGPNWKSAKENIRLLFKEAVPEIESGLWFKDANQGYSWKGHYNSKWKIEMPTPEISVSTFSFGFQSFHLVPYETPKEFFDPVKVYLDINKAWDKEVFNTMIRALNGKAVYVYYNGKMHQLTPQNRNKLFDKRSSLNFTLFPFHKIEEPEKALVISTYSGLTPTLDDLSNSIFANSATQFFQKDLPDCRVFNIGDQWSPYLHSLQSLQVINGQSGSITLLKSQLKEKRFPISPKRVEGVPIPMAGMKIVATQGGSNKAPDHLMRLYVYHELMDRIGRNYFNRKDIEESLLDLARSAHVLSPVSSLVVLETQEDYDRFGIDTRTKGLDNASLKGTGAVPEPHEWMLILLCLGTAIVLWMKNRPLANV